MIIYISGPMRGKPNLNYDTFNEVEQALYEWYKMYGSLSGNAFDDDPFRVLNPAKNFGGDTTRPPTEYMAVDLEQVLESDALVLLPGWETSEYGKLEVQVAKSTGKRFYQAFSISNGNSDWQFVEMDEPVTVQSIRGGVLDEARSLITGDRNNTYGPPHADFQRSADAANAYGYRGPDGRPVAAHDIAILVSLVKLSRLMWTPDKRDSWVDLAGYAGCGYECVVEEGKQ